MKFSYFSIAMLFLSFGVYANVNNAKTIKQNMISANGVEYILSSVSESDILKCTLEVSNNYKDILIDITKNNYTFSLYNEKDINTFISEMSNGITKLTGGANYKKLDTSYLEHRIINIKDTLIDDSFERIIDTTILDSRASTFHFKYDTLLPDIIFDSNQSIISYSQKIKDIHISKIEIVDGKKIDFFHANTLYSVFYNIFLQQAKDSKDEQPYAGQLQLKKNNIEVVYCIECNSKDMVSNFKSYKNYIISEMIEYEKYHNAKYCRDSIRYRSLFYKCPGSIDKKDSVCCKDSVYYIDTLCDKNTYKDKVITNSLISCIKIHVDKLLKLDSVLDDKYKLTEMSELLRKYLSNNNNKIKEKINNIIKEVTENISTIDSKVSLSNTDDTLEYSQMVFENGNLSEIKLVTDVKDDTISMQPYSIGEKVIFQNNVPIGFSSRKNYMNLSKYYLYDSKYGFYRIKLADVINNYFPALNNYTRDYSPADTTISFNANSKDNYIRIPLKKSKNNNLFDIQLYSDFVGIGDDKANGLIQTELRYRINLNTFYKQMKYITTFKKHTWSGVAYFTNISPYILVSKIEKNGRYLGLSSYDNNTSTIQRLKLLEYSNFRAGFNLNIVSFHFPKFNWQLINTSLDFGRTSISDSSQKFYDTITKKDIILTNNFGVSTIMYTPFSTEINFLPEERFKFDIKYSLGLLFLLSDKVSMNGSDKFRNNMIHSVELKARYRLAKVGYLFARYRLNFQNNVKVSNFHQAQVGINLSIFDIFNR